MKHKTGRKQLSFLLTLAMLVGLLPGLSLPARATDEHDHTGWDEWTSATSLPSTAGNYYLKADVTINSTWNVPNGTTKLCLNGYGIMLTGEDSVITVSSSDARLELYDEGTGAHYITLTDGRGTAVSDSAPQGVTYVEVSGGYITGGKASNGGGVYVNSGGTFTMSGGSITGNTASSGGGINVFSGTFTMEGGTISGNTAEYNGGGVFVQPGTFTMSGGQITNNTSNTSSDGWGGGGVCIAPFSASSTFEMTGGSITGNTTTGNGGGVYAFGTLNLSGDAVIKNNLKGSDQSNIYLRKNEIITITDELTGTEPIGVTMEEPGTFTRDWTTQMSGKAASSFFTSDNSAYRVITSNNELALVAHTHNFSTYALSADGKTITATCDADGCPLPPSSEGAGDHVATLTIAAPTEGSDATITVSPKDAITGYTVKYQSKNGSTWGEETTTAPTAAGIHKASITLTGTDNKPATASVAYGVNAITKGIVTGENYDFTVPRVATVGAKVTPEFAIAPGYEVKKITVKDASNNDVSNNDSVKADKAGFTMPDYNVTVDIEFGKIDYTITKNSMTFGSVMVKKGDNEVTTAQIGDTITLNATPDTGFELTSLTVKYGENSDAALSGSGNTRSFIMPASNVTVSAVFEGAPFGITISSEITGGTVTAPAATAKAGSEVTLTVTPDAGYDLGSVTVTTESGGAVPVTDNKFTMPTEKVTVTAAFVGHTTTATLKVTGSGTAELRDDNFAAVTGGSVVKKAGEKFVLSVSSDDEYDYTIGFDPSREVSRYVQEFSEKDYKNYVAYAQTNHIPLSFQTDLFWVTMPGANDNKIDVNVTFQQVKSFTILYRPTDNANAVWCKFTNPTAGIEEKPFAVEMKQDAVMGDQVVWSAKVTAAFAPNQIAFAATSDSLANASMTDGFTVKQSIQNESDWTSFGSDDGKFVVISGDVKTVVAAFVTNPSSMAVYDSETVTFAAPESSTGIVHVITVCATDADGKVTSAGTLTALAAPTVDAVPTGKEFAGWRGAYFETLDSKVVDHVYAAGDKIRIRENTTFHAVWNPKILTVAMNLNGGTGVDNTASVEYDHALTLSSDPTKSGYDFGGWTVNEAVTEGGVYFGSGSAFDTSKPITADLELTAQWKHIHSYTYYKISDFGDALKDYQSYESKLHIRACGCDDFGFEAHSFDSSGKCSCGYQKLTETVTLKISYGKWDGTAYTLKMVEADRKAVKGQKVSVYAPGSLGPDMKFSKWQYSADGSTWKDLTSYRMMGFPIPADMQLRALYTNPVTKPQISLGATTYPVMVDNTPLNTILLQMDYQLPDGYYYVDSGVKASDNIGIAYYEMKEVKKTAGQKAALAGVKLGIGFLTGGGIGDFLVDQTMDAMSDPEYYYDKRENSVLDIMTAETLSDYIYNGKPVNMEKFDPLYWDYRPDTKGQSGSLNALIPLNAVQKNNWNHYIYGIAWLRYKDKAGIIQTIYTPALATTIDGVGSSTRVEKTGN